MGVGEAPVGVVMRGRQATPFEIIPSGQPQASALFSRESRPPNETHCLGFIEEHEESEVPSGQAASETNSLPVEVTHALREASNEVPVAQPHTCGAAISKPPWHKPGLVGRHAPSAKVKEPILQAARGRQKSFSNTSPALQQLEEITSRPPMHARGLLRVEQEFSLVPSAHFPCEAKSVEEVEAQVEVKEEKTLPAGQQLAEICKSSAPAEFCWHENGELVEQEPSAVPSEQPESTAKGIEASISCA